MIKLFKIIFAFLLLTFVVSNTALAEGVVENIEGFPLMAGFSENESRALFFDKPEGRVVEGLLEGSSSIEGAKSFYQQSLIQIGWLLQPDLGGEHSLYFNKEGEVLTLEFRQVKDKLQIMVFLVPVGVM